jgi:hypothetical protein
METICRKFDREFNDQPNEYLDKVYVHKDKAFAKTALYIGISDRTDSECNCRFTEVKCSRIR